MRCCILCIHLNIISAALLPLPQRLFRFAIRVVPFLLPGLSTIAPYSPVCPSVFESLAVYRHGPWVARRRQNKKGEVFFRVGRGCVKARKKDAPHSHPSQCPHTPQGRVIFLTTTAHPRNTPGTPRHTPRNTTEQGHGTPRNSHGTPGAEQTQAKTMRDRGRVQAKK